MQGNGGAMLPISNANLRLRFRCLGFMKVVAKIGGGYMEDVADMVNWGIEIGKGSCQGGPRML